MACVVRPIAFTHLPNVAGLPWRAPGRSLIRYRRRRREFGSISELGGGPR